MSSKQEETASEIPAILHDVNNKTKYERLRFFGKVTTFPYFSSFVFSVFSIVRTKSWPFYALTIFLFIIFFWLSCFVEFTMILTGLSDHQNCRQYEKKNKSPIVSVHLWRSWIYTPCHWVFLTGLIFVASMQKVRIHIQCAWLELMFFHQQFQFNRT